MDQHSLCSRENLTLTTETKRMTGQPSAGHTRMVYHGTYPHVCDPRALQGLETSTDESVSSLRVFQPDLASCELEIRRSILRGADYVTIIPQNLFAGIVRLKFLLGTVRDDVVIDVVP